MRYVQKWTLCFSFNLIHDRITIVTHLTTIFSLYCDRCIFWGIFYKFYNDNIDNIDLIFNLLSWKINNEYFHSCNSENIFIRCIKFAEFSIPFGCTLHCRMENSIFKLMKIFLPVCSWTIHFLRNKKRVACRRENTRRVCKTRGVAEILLTFMNIFTRRTTISGLSGRHIAFVII